jgi:hypothetical protein
LPTSIAFSDIQLGAQDRPFLLSNNKYMKKQTITDKPVINNKFSSKILLNMAEALNEISIDFEVLDERLDRDAKAQVLKEIRDDLTNIFWNYKLIKKNKYDNLK